MIDHIIPMIMGALIGIIGVFNMMGNVRMIKRNHRHRVAPEDMKAFGKIVGIGTLLNGAGIFLFGLFGLLAMLSGAAALNIIGTVLLVIGIAAGLPVMIFAMIKYNKGIF